ncbi:structural maintenance of chromosomes protein [Anaeramoeba flamelloides]|uniref:Structural maintenance of chromosomes protein n=1 Tax=Anaeramoeba flamelloides TaxID=1746091 RepID=A0AAV7YGT2_9EUKA|nr:structural maintenance of chromosomes protein [Anaeramoeba flamelloides]
MNQNEDTDNYMKNYMKKMMTLKTLEKEIKALKLNKKKSERAEKKRKEIETKKNEIKKRLNKQRIKIEEYDEYLKDAEKIKKELQKNKTRLKEKQSELKDLEEKELEINNLGSKVPPIIRLQKKIQKIDDEFQKVTGKNYDSYKFTKELLESMEEMESNKSQNMKKLFRGTPKHKSFEKISRKFENILISLIKKIESQKLDPNITHDFFANLNKVVFSKYEYIEKNNPETDTTTRIVMDIFEKRKKTPLKIEDADFKGYVKQLLIYFDFLRKNGYKVNKSSRTAGETTVISELKQEKNNIKIQVFSFDIHKEHLIIRNALSYIFKNN